MEYFDVLIDWIKENKPSKQKLSSKKLTLCKEFKRKGIPTDIEILTHASQQDIDEIKPYLQTKPTRTGSGVAVVATMSKPFVCPHGSCIYCPGGPGSEFGDTPKSYTGKEPSTMRGIRHEFDPYRIIFNRLEQYIIIGQNPDKVDQIIMGGTFPSFPKEYQEEFVKNSFKAYNDFSDLFYPGGEFDITKFKEFFELPGKVGDDKRASSIKEKVLQQKNKNNNLSLQEEQKRNEISRIRCIGLTVETKPDWGRKEHGLLMLEFGVTRVELGIQTTRDDILHATNRGHSLEESKQSIAELRDLGFKLNFHMMPGLPEKKEGKLVRVSFDEDIRMLREIFESPDFKPDMLKIYPCMVMPGTPLEKIYQRGEFIPISTDQAADTIVEMKRFVPRWCRIMRIQRDIPTSMTTSGVDKTNLRQIVSERAKKAGVKCQCIRCREIGTNKEELTNIHLETIEYEAANGKEFFISAESDQGLLGFIRLRIPPRSLHKVITEESSLVRELHVYGTAVAIGKESQRTQHKGIGKQLLAKAEEISKKEGRDKVVVISGVGVRGYYQKQGYHFQDPYMVKSL